MKPVPIDIRYVYAQLGLDVGTSLEEIERVLIHAQSYRFFTKERVELITEWIAFFKARLTLGDMHTSFADIRKSYHQKAMFLHPDRNPGDMGTEEQLKDITVAYARVEKIYRQANEYYKKDEKTRRDHEEEARQITLRERSTEEEKSKEKSSRTTFSDPFRQWGGHEDKKSSSKRETPRPVRPRKYMAASVPRFLRQTRLGYLPLHCIIGSRITKGDGGSHLFFDIIMLPMREFLRMKTNIGLQHIITPQLKAGPAFSPVFILTDTKEVNVPDDEPDPQTFARKYFLKKFNLESI